MTLSTPLLLVLGLLVAAALGVGVVLLDRRRSAALGAGLGEGHGRLCGGKIDDHVAQAQIRGLAPVEPHRDAARPGRHAHGRQRRPLTFGEGEKSR